MAGPDGTAGCASSKEAPFVSVVDLVRGALVDRVEVPGSEGLTGPDDGSRVFVAAPSGLFTRVGAAPATGIRVIDTKPLSVTDVLPTANVVFPVHPTVPAYIPKAA